MQFTAPVDDSVSVTEPAAHTAHATVEALLYCPAEHASQLAAPTEGPPNMRPKMRLAMSPEDARKCARRLPPDNSGANTIKNT